MARFLTVLGALCAALLVPGVVLAGEGHPNIPGAQLSVLWAIPFVCMLLSIAIMPLALPHFWEKHFGKIAAFWGLAFLTPCLLVYGFNVALYEFLHIILLDYVPFLVRCYTLYHRRRRAAYPVRWFGTPAVNTGLLAVGTVLASWMGTTGAAMLLIRPLLRANAAPQIPCSFSCIFYFSCGQYWRLAHASGRSAAVSGFSEGCGFLLDHNQPVDENKPYVGSFAGYLLCP